MNKKETVMKLKEISWGAAAFALPALLFLTVLWKGGFYPFGEKSMLIMDMRDQYVAFFTSLRDALFGDDSLFFSWSRSMGGNYWGIVTYYIASPLSFLTLFFSVEHMPAAIEMLTILKLGLCGVSFFIFGSHLARGCAGLISEQRMKPLLLALSLCYALMSYNMVYSMSLMWLDGVILLPLILLGVEKILEGRKGFLYLATLSMLLISNYYTGYMVGLYTGMYLLFRTLSTMTGENFRERLGQILRFALLSALSIGIAAPVIFGSWKDLSQGKLTASGTSYAVDFSQKNFDSLGKLLGKYTNGSYDSITNSGLPAIYCGYLVLALALVFILLRTIRLRERIGALAILGILGISLYYTSLDTAWHGFQIPNWFPYRYAFLLSFTLIYMACRALIAFPEIRKKAARKGRPAKKKKNPNQNARPDYEMAGRHRKWLEMVGAIALILLVSAEMRSNASALLAGLDGEFSYMPIAQYNEFLDKTKPLVEQIQKEDKGFYRINQGYEFSKNDAMLLGYHGMTHYSSTFNAAINSLTPKLGISQTYFWNSGYGSNAMLDSLFSVKYILADKAVPASYEMQKDSQKGTASYKNPLVLPLAYGSAPATLSPDLGDASPFVNQNRFFRALAATDEDYFTSQEYSLSQNGNVWNYDFTAVSDNPIYLYMRAEGTSYANVFVNDSWVGNYFTSETNGTIFLGNFSQGHPVNVRIEASADQEVNLYYSEISELHMETLTPTLEKLKNNGISLKSHQNGKLSGTITLEEGQDILTSIPYDEGWRIRVDGKEAEAEKFADTFLAIKCPAGKHEIWLSYLSPGIAAGAAASAISIMLALLFFFGGRLRQAVRTK